MAILHIQAAWKLKKMSPPMAWHSIECDGWMLLQLHEQASDGADYCWQGKVREVAEQGCLARILRTDPAGDDGDEHHQDTG